MLLKIKIAVKHTANSNTHLTTMAIDANYYDAKLYNYLEEIFQLALTKKKCKM